MGNTPAITVELKPMSLSELLDRTFAIYRNNFWLLCGLMALPQLVVLVSQLGTQILFPVRIVPIAAANAQNPFAALASIRSNFGAQMIVLIFTLVCHAFALGAITLAVSEICLGRRASISESYKLVRKRIAGLIGLILTLLLVAVVFIFAGAMVGGLLGALLGSGLELMAGGSAAIKMSLIVIVVILVFACLLGGMALAFWLLMRFAVSIPVFLLERLGVMDSLSRSGALTRGHRWRILGACIIMYIVEFGVQSIFTMPFIIITFMDSAKGLLPLWLQMGSAVAAAVSGVLAVPLMMITLALVYFDVRIRKEAFDLETMMAGLLSSAAVTAGPPMSSE